MVWYGFLRQIWNWANQENIIVKLHWLRQFNGFYFSLSAISIYFIASHKEMAPCERPKPYNFPNTSVDNSFASVLTGLTAL